jgi:hypothetical protein
MSNSSKSVNSVTRMCNVPSRALGVDLRDRCGTVHDGLTRAPRLDEAELRSRPSVMPAMTRLDRQNTAPWSSILAFSMEGFALYGASYCASPHALATSPVEPSPTRASAPEPEEISWRARRRAMAIVSFSIRSEVTEVEDDADRAGPGSETASGDASSDTGRSNRRHWLTKPWHAIASRWAQRRREREIKKAIAGSVELDCGVLRGIGIPNRSRIEQDVRYRRDC